MSEIKWFSPAPSDHSPFLSLNPSHSFYLALHHGTCNKFCPSACPSTSPTVLDVLVWLIYWAALCWIGLLVLVVYVRVCHYGYELFIWLCRWREYKERGINYWWLGTEKEIGKRLKVGGQRLYRWHTRNWKIKVGKRVEENVCMFVTCIIADLRRVCWFC